MFIYNVHVHRLCFYHFISFFANIKQRSKPEYILFGLRMNASSVLSLARNELKRNGLHY